MRSSKLLSFLALCTMGIAGVAISSAESPAPSSSNQQTYQGVSRPSEDKTIGFTRPGLVAEVLVQEGEEVKEHQLVARQDDKEEQANLKIDKVKSEDMTAINAEITVNKKDQGDLALKQSVHATAQEIADADLEVKVSEARVDKAKADKEELVLKYQANQVAVDKLNLYAPMAGRVVIEDTFVKAGENAESGKANVIRIVQIDPMYVMVPLPVSEAVRHKEGDAAKVTFHKDLLGYEKELSGQIDKIKPVGDASSGTIMVRLKVPNPDKITPGEIVDVRFPTPKVAMKP
jgi:membrane fusion protein (multidrug efflux system)